MMKGRITRLRAGIAAALVLGVALVVAGCGSSSSSSTSVSASPVASTASSASATSPAAAGMMISTAKGTDGTYLVGSSGRALYLWAADVGGKSVCSGACAKAWPPLTTTATPTVGTGVNASDLGTVMRSDGTKQVTYKGHPLYYFVADTSRGQTRGQGSNNFGAKWWLVAPSGVAITAGGSSAAASSGGSGGSSSSGSSSSSGGGSAWG